MSTYDVGDRARLYLSLTDITGAPANGTVVLTVTSPSDVASTPSVVNDSTGEYHADVDVTEEGRWTFRWVSTGAVIASESGVFVARAASPLGIVSLAEAKDHLQITTEIDDDELREWIDTATEWVEDRIGPVVRRTVTESHRLGNYSDTLVLNESPVVSITSITTTNPTPTFGFDSGITTATPYLDAAAGTVYIGPSTWSGTVTVAYVAGRSVIPSKVRRACLMYLKSLWETQRGSTELPIQGFSEEGVSDSGGLLVYKAEQLLKRHLRADGQVA